MLSPNTIIWLFGESAFTSWLLKRYIFKPIGPPFTPRAPCRTLHGTGMKNRPARSGPSAGRHLPTDNPKSRKA